MASDDPDGYPAGPLTAALGGSVEQVRRLSGGAVRATWSFVHLADGTRRPLVLQVRRRPAASGLAMTDEAELVRRAGAAGVPVAPVVAAGEDDGFGGGWMVTGRVAGETIPRKLLRDPDYEPARGRLVGQCGRALAAVHALDPGTVPALAPMDRLETFAGVLADLVPMFGPRPALELGLRRLRRTRPPAGPTAVVHGDFRTGNLVVGPEGLRAVLDWELAHLGDPLEDLGWFCVRSWRFGGPGRAGGFGAVEELCAAYAGAGGRVVEPAEVAWWEALGCFTWAVMCMVQAAAHLGGQARSLELAAVGRRVCESEWDLLTLLGVHPADDPAPAPAPAAPDPLFGRPTAAELAEALREFLAGEQQGAGGFAARVAANMAATVRRQLERGPALVAAHAGRLAALGLDGDDALARAVAGGDGDEDGSPLAAAVASDVRDQLLVANPGHLGRPGEQ